MASFEKARSSVCSGFGWVVWVTSSLLFALAGWVGLRPVGEMPWISLVVGVRDVIEETYIHSSMGGRPEGFVTRGDERSHNSSSIWYRRAMTASGRECAILIHKAYDRLIGSQGCTKEVFDGRVRRRR